MDPERTSYARWVRIDLDAIGYNVAQVKRLLKPGVRLMAVVKADGYGHGLIPSAQVALAQGADMLGVTHPEEGVLLRESGIDVPILVFRPLLPGEEEIMVAYSLTPSVSDLQQAERLAAAAQNAGVQVPFHVKIDTGMTRTGFAPHSFKEVVDELLTFRELQWEGVYTHFAAAATDPSFTRHQYQLFMDLVKPLFDRGVRIPICHVCNSAAFLLYPEMHLDMVRVGTLLYGQLPAGVKFTYFEPKDAWSFWTKVIHLHRVSRGATVGYGRTFRARRDTLLAILPVGYSDGFGIDVTSRPSGLLDLAKVLVKIAGNYFGMHWGTNHVNINGMVAPIVGRIGMELSCVDVGKIPEVEIETPVFLPARRTVLKASIPRLYVSGEELVKSSNGRESGSEG